MRFIGKAVAGLLILVLAAGIILHTPAAQDQITRRLAAYLSARIGAPVTLESIRFSIRGDLRLDGLELRDRAGAEILAAGRLRVHLDMAELFSGRLVLDNLWLEDVSGRLDHGPEGLSIDFVLDAFSSGKKKSKPSTPFALACRKLGLANIRFVYADSVSGTSLTARLDSLACTDISFATLPNALTVSDLRMRGAHADIRTNPLKEHASDTPKSTPPAGFTPDFGLGMAIAIRHLDIADSGFYVDRGDTIRRPGFDPSHMVLEDILIRASDLSMRDDSLFCSLDTLSAFLPEALLAGARGKIQMSRERMSLSGAQLTANTSRLDLDLAAWYGEAGTTSGPEVRVHARGRIDPHEIVFFAGDPMRQYLEPFTTIEVSVDGQYANGQGHLEKLHVVTDASEVNVSGRIDNIRTPRALSWKDLSMSASIGRDIRKVVSSMVDQVNLPDGIRLNLRSTGSLANMLVDGDAFTSWGHAGVSGRIRPQGREVGLDVDLTGKDIRLDRWTGITTLGAVDLDMRVAGTVGTHPELEASGTIGSIGLRGVTVRDIAVNGQLAGDSSMADIAIRDPAYPATAHLTASLADPLRVAGDVLLEGFQVGRLLAADTTMSLSGHFIAQLELGDSAITAVLSGDRLAIEHDTLGYTLDSLSLEAHISKSESRLRYRSSDATADLDANFDVRDAPGIFRALADRLFDPEDTPSPFEGNRRMTVNLDLQEAGILRFLGLPVAVFSPLRFRGLWDAPGQQLTVEAVTGMFKAGSLAFDTLRFDLLADGHHLVANAFADTLVYGDRSLGRLTMAIEKPGDTAFTRLTLVRDSLFILGMYARVLPDKTGACLYPDSLKVIGTAFGLTRDNPVCYSNGSLTFNDLAISGDDSSIALDGDLDSFTANFARLDLTALNAVLFPDSSVIRQGRLNGRMHYAAGRKLDMEATLDSLVINQAGAVSITARAMTEQDQVPFELELTSAANVVRADGRYDLASKEMDAAVRIALDSLAELGKLASDVIGELGGSIRGEAHITGPVNKPAITGALTFRDVRFATVAPRFAFQVKNETVTLDNAMLAIDDFELLDEDGRPLTIDGRFTFPDLPRYEYDLAIRTDGFALMDVPASSTDPLRGLLMIASDIRLNGNENERSISADIDVLDTTSLMYVMANTDVELINTKGIIEFVPPEDLLDTAALAASMTYYDSVVASLPKLDLKAKVTIGDSVRLKMVTNAYSGDYFETQGGAQLEMEFDRTGNVQLTGHYTIRQGVYRLSFYELVKKDFRLVPGSTITWTGSPRDGDLDVKAIYTIASNSIGLVGNEVSESEKSTYKRSLDYEVGVIIKGSLDKPEISFSLDLPAAEKTSYPVLANKLERLRQPEFQSELNKQVFGLLVLGGFLPETSGSDIDQAQIATTAITNSVNSLLASQLNRFAGQYIKGVNIDVGIQSYSDYSTPGGKTQTAMDFRVSKTLFNDRLSFEIGGDFDISTDQSGSNKGNNYRGDVAIIYDLSGNADKLLKLFNNESYDIVYQEIRNTGISLVFIREFDKAEKAARSKK